MGLELSLSYVIVKAHGGVLPIAIGTIGIKVETKESEGAEFVVNLPHSSTQIV